MGEYYFTGIGLLSGGVFYKDITNVIFSDKSAYQENGVNYIVTQAKKLRQGESLWF